MGGELAYLSDRPRHENLKKMKQLGTWERQQMEKEQGQLRIENYELRIKKEETTMTDKIRKDGTCGLCDKTGRAKMIKGEFCCTTCEGIRRNAMKRPDMMLAQIREFHPELLEGSGTGADREALNAELASANISLVGKLRALEADAKEQNELLQGSLDRKIAEINGLRDILAAAPGVSVADTGRQLMNELQTLRVEMAELSASGPQALLDAVFPEETPAAAAAGEDSLPPNAELAAANIRLGQKLWEMEQEKKLFDTAVKVVENERDTAVSHLEEIKKAMHREREEKETAQSHLMDLRGELEGLQDVLSSWEQERSAMLQERVRQSDQVRWLHEQLAATERKADGLEKEIDRLLEHGRGLLAETGGVAGETYLLTDIADENVSQRIKVGGAGWVFGVVAADPSDQLSFQAIPCPAGYESLTAVLAAALDQAGNGKGLERHAKAGEPFDRQKICEITRRVGLGYPLGQAIKKAEESIRLGERGPHEILGAINYLAAAHICMSELVEQGQPSEVAA